MGRGLETRGQRRERYRPKGTAHAHRNHEQTGCSDIGGARLGTAQLFRCGGSANETRCFGKEARVEELEAPRQAPARPEGASAGPHQRNPGGPGEGRVLHRRADGEMGLHNGRSDEALPGRSRLESNGEVGRAQLTETGSRVSDNRRCITDAFRHRLDSRTRTNSAATIGPFAIPD
jgi:hypothetical protein